MEEEIRGLLVELTGIIEDLCRNQVKVLEKIATHREVPESLRSDLGERVRNLELYHHRLRKFIEKVNAGQGR